MTIERFKSSGMIGIFKTFVKAEISAMKPNVATSMKWGTIFYCLPKYTHSAQWPYSLILIFLIVMRVNHVGFITYS